MIENVHRLRSCQRNFLLQPLLFKECLGSRTAHAEARHRARPPPGQARHRRLTAGGVGGLGAHRTVGSVLAGGDAHVVVVGGPQAHVDLAVGDPGVDKDGVGGGVRLLDVEHAGPQGGLTSSRVAGESHRVEVVLELRDRKSVV